jgi:sugar lactone lactonase YvrE
MWDPRAVRRLRVSEPLPVPVVELAEGPAWDANFDALVWVDIAGGDLYVDDLRGGSRSFRVEAPLGAALPARGGGWLVVLRDAFALLDADGTLQAPLASVPAERLRFNDAKVDPLGRAWGGTMAYAEDAPLGALYRLDPGPVATEVVADVQLSNGLGWSPAGDVMYFADSLAGTVRAFDYDLDTARPANERVLVELPAEQGLPDGLAVDDDGCFWLAVWNAGEVHRYTPAGTLDAVVELPVARPTSCCFGPDGTLYITTAWYTLEPAERAAQPFAGAVFAVDVGATAPPATLWEPLEA